MQIQIGNLQIKIKKVDILSKAHTEEEEIDNNINFNINFTPLILFDTSTTCLETSKLHHC